MRVVTRTALASAVQGLRDPAAERPEVPSCWVYFIRSGEGGPIKIGHARDPYTRLMNLRTASPEPVTYLGHVAGGIDEERALHKRFGHLRIRGEWFLPAPELLDFIAERRFDGDL